MATIDKTSIREEVKRLKEEFDQLSSEGKVSSEVQVVMNSFLVVLELILSIFLEKKTHKNNQNSSIPSSQTAKDETSALSSKSKRKGQFVSGNVSNSRTKETISISRASTCHVCGNILDKTPFRVDSKNHWIHVYSSGDITLKLLHRKRGKEAIENLNIIPRWRCNNS